jgi:primosomal protein N' (replication factor Y)
MEFFDILFPVNIGPLTYRCPERLSGVIKTGMVVSAPLRNRLAKGIILGKSSAAPSIGLKDIQEVHGVSPLFSRATIDLLKWMSDYYMTGQGLVLKTILPKEALKQVTRRGKIKERAAGHPLSVEVDTDNIDLLEKAISRGAYGTFLLHSPSSAYEYSLLMKLLPGVRNAIILVPEVSVADHLYPFFRDFLGERLSLFHGEMSSGRRSETIELILSGRSDIVLGTRSAIFLPLKKVSFIAVVQEHSESYKQEKSPCYIGRDVAVMRGYLDKATVLLTSICPSIESLFNCKAGKYMLLKPTHEVKRPRIRLVDMKREKLARPYLSQAVTDAAAEHVRNNNKVMFVLNRRGHSTLLQCSDCSHIEECPNCRIPLVFHKQDMSLKCHYCGHALYAVPELCSVCRGHNLKLSGAGTQKVQEDLHELIGVKTLRLDSDKAGRKSGLECMSSPIRDNRIIIGTKLMTRRLCSVAEFSMAAFLNTDLSLNMPDFRSAEKTYREIVSVLTGIDTDGEIFIQTRMPGEYLYRFLKNYDYRSFIREELARRKTLNYPPYSRLLLLKCISGRNLSAEITEILKAIEDVEILGPHEARNIRGKNEFSLLLKSPIRGKLHSAAAIFINAFKDLKDVKVKIDVDPVTI